MPSSHVDIEVSLGIKCELQAKLLLVGEDLADTVRVLPLHDKSDRRYMNK